MTNTNKTYGLCDAQTGYYLGEASEDQLALFKDSEDGIFRDELIWGDRDLTVYASDEDSDED